MGTILSRLPLNFRILKICMSFQAAIKSRAQQIITYNLADFPNEHLDSLDLEAVHPDILLESVFDLYPGPCNRVNPQLAW
jgi:hypothetical protein